MSDVHLDPRRYQGEYGVDGARDRTVLIDTGTPPKPVHDSEIVSGA
jgi:hypothetical protein